jgi:hypothetical protein
MFDISLKIIYKKNMKWINGNKNIRYSVRISGRTTSIYIRRCIVALYVTIHCSDEEDKKDFVLESIQKILDKWKKEDNKGLSDYITVKMMEKVSGEYLKEFKENMKTL